jgi:hypothetical protein
MPTRFEERLQAIQRMLRSRELPEIINAMAANRRWVTGSRHLIEQAIFKEFESALKTGPDMAERLLFDRNIPPREQEAASDYRSLWIAVSSDIFSFSPSLSHEFPQSLIERCLERLTNSTFAILHSAAISDMVRHNVTRIDFTKCRDVLAYANDSRATYALNALRWDPHWSQISESVFKSLLSDYPGVSLAARAIIRQRATLNELQNFATHMDQEIPHDILNSSSVDSLLDYLSSATE